MKKKTDLQLYNLYTYIYMFVYISSLDTETEKKNRAYALFSTRYI